MLPDRDLLALRDMVTHAQEAVDLLGKTTLAGLRRDRQLQLALERLVEVVGEASTHVSEPTQTLADVDWKGLRALRNVLAHRYDIVDHALLHRIVAVRLARDIPRLRQALGSDHV